MILAKFVCFSGYMKAKKHLQEGNYGSIIECCQNELANPLTPYKVESLLLRATLYQLRGESKKAMDDLTALINIENSPLKVSHHQVHHHYRSTMQGSCIVKQLCRLTEFYLDFSGLEKSWKLVYQVKHLVIVRFCNVTILPSIYCDTGYGTIQCLSPNLKSITSVELCT